MKNVYHGDCVLEAAENMARFSKIMNFPQYITEHKIDVFGPTVPEVLNHSNENTKIYPKTRFSMFDLDFINKNFSENELFILLGVEAHICVTQTALTILESNRKLVLVVDAISSRNSGERDVGLSNLKSCGSYLTTSEALMFLYLKDSNNKDFKTCLPMFKKVRKMELINESNKFL
jgi:isochorismate hydrolase